MLRNISVFMARNLPPVPPTEVSVYLKLFRSFVFCWTSFHLVLWNVKNWSVSTLVAQGHDVPSDPWGAGKCAFTKKDVKEDRWWQNTRGSWYQWWRQLNARRSTWQWGRHDPWWSYITTTKALLSSWLKCIFANTFTTSKTTLYNNLLWMFWPDLLPFYFFQTILLVQLTCENQQSLSTLWINVVYSWRLCLSCTH